jgi:ribosome biogenesis protein Nip4
MLLMFADRKRMGEVEEFRLPRVNAINRYISAYISGLNQHIPFLHVPTLNLNELQMPRLLAMCSLGALFCFEKEHAARLHIASMKFLHLVCLSML